MGSPSIKQKRTSNDGLSQQQALSSRTGEGKTLGEPVQDEWEGDPRFRDPSFYVFWLMTSDASTFLDPTRVSFDHEGLNSGNPYKRAEMEE